MGVTQGSGGGIGRVELLLAEMLQVLAGRDQLEFRIFSRETHPSYLQEAATEGDGRAMGKAAFASLVLRQFLSWKPDAVIFSHVNQAPIGLAMRVLRPSAKQVVIVYGWDVWFGVPGLRRRGLGQMDAVWSISQFTASKLAETTGYPAGRVKLLVPVLTPAQALSFASTKDLRPGAGRRLLSIARLDAGERQKGIDHTLRAMHKLRRELPELTYTIVGDGGDRKRLEAITRDLDLGRSVVFAGWVSPSELSELYGACDMFVLPSAQEGFGLVFLEAMAAGKPVIAARAGAAPEVVLDGVTGLLVDYGDEEALAAAIARLVRDPDLHATMGRAGRARFVENFSFEGATQRLAELMQELGVIATSSGSGSRP